MMDHQCWQDRESLNGKSQKLSTQYKLNITVHNIRFVASGTVVWIYISSRVNDN